MKRKCDPVDRFTGTYPRDHYIQGDHLSQAIVNTGLVAIQSDIDVSRKATIKFFCLILQTIQQLSLFLFSVSE